MFQVKYSYNRRQYAKAEAVFSFPKKILKGVNIKKSKVYFLKFRLTPLDMRCRDSNMGEAKQNRISSVRRCYFKSIISATEIFTFFIFEFVFWCRKIAHLLKLNLPRYHEVILRGDTYLTGFTVL